MLEIGSLIDNKYKILSEIGRGGMNIVYMAINEKANKTWAIKEVRRDKTKDFNTITQRLIVEMDTLKKLNHPNLPSIVDVIENEDSFLIVMDYIEGRSLDKIIQEEGAQKESDVVKWAKQLCDVFIYLHSQKPAIIYRDMKPANIMLKPDNSIMLIDFGAVKNMDVELGATTGIGTRGYAAPEQYMDSGMGRTDARTDIYCLGMTLYHLLTNINPCINLITNHSIRSVNPALSNGLDSIVQKCIQYNPEERYQNCAELMYDLENYQLLEPLYKKKQKKKLFGFCGVVLMSLVLGISGFGLNLIASQKATDTYADKLYEASKTTDYETKLDIYQECISIPNKSGKKEAYLGLIQTFKENDSVFSVEEAKLLEKLITNHKIPLQENPEIYTEICFEIGKLFWYYYDYGDGSQITKAKSSIEWFQDVLENAPDDFKNLGMAKVYANIGIFYRDITTNITEANDTDTYKPLFENLLELMNSVAFDENENEIVRLELVELTRSAIQQYATKFKIDGVSLTELTALYQSVSEIGNSIVTTTDKTNEMKEYIILNLPDTLSAIEDAYVTEKGGDTL